MTRMRNMLTTVQITSVDGSQERPVLGRRKTRAKHVRPSIDVQKLEKDDPDGSLTRVSILMDPDI